MWKYIITWCLVNHYSKECDCNKSRIDEFGRTVQNNYAVYCEETVYDCGHKKEFLNRKDSYQFFNKAKSEICIIPKLGSIDSVKIDSVYVK